MFFFVTQEVDSNSLTADNLEKFGKLNCSPGIPEEGTLLSEAKLQSIISFLDEMEKSEQERPRSAASASQREVSFIVRADLQGIQLTFRRNGNDQFASNTAKLYLMEQKRGKGRLDCSLINSCWSTG